MNVSISTSDLDRVEPVRLGVSRVFELEGRVIIPARTFAHVVIGDVSICMSVEQAAQLRDALAAALSEHEQTAAPAVV